jgi:hypothetical protein
METGTNAASPHADSAATFNPGPNEHNERERGPKGSPTRTTTVSKPKTPEKQQPRGDPANHRPGPGDVAADVDADRGVEYKSQQITRRSCRPLAGCPSVSARASARHRSPLQGA